MDMSDNLGAAPDRSHIAILLIDVINDLDFPEAPQMLPSIKPLANSISDLLVRARTARIPIVYVNDNFGRWRSDFRAQVEYCMREESLGRELVEQLQPHDEDYFVLKPKHSGFYSTTLDTLLKLFGADTLVLCGIAANICVLFTANDAYMRDYHIIVPQDCIASNSKEITQHAIAQMRDVLKADTRASTQLRFESFQSGRNDEV